MSARSAERASPGAALARPRLRGDILGVAVLVAAALALFAPLWLRGQVWNDGDLGFFYWPTMQTVFASLRQGHLPVWTPAMLGGFPLYADGSVGTLFPLNWVLLAWPTALMLIPFGRMVLAAVGMYLFVRALGVGPLGSVIAGLVFALNGFAVAHFSHIDLANGTAMLPYVLVAVEMSLRSQGWPKAGLWLLGAGVAYGLAWVSLHPMAPLMILLVFAPWVIYRGLAERGRAGLVWVVAALIVPVVVAIGLSSAQVVPMLELAAASPRQTAGLRFNSSYSLPLYDLIGLVWPTFFHSANGGVQWGLWNLETLTYIGTLPFVLALVTVAAWPRRRHVAFFVVLGLLALWTALGQYAPIGPQPWLYALPGFSVLRAPARFFYIIAFAGAYLAGLGADWLLARQWTAAQARRVKWLLVALAALAVLIPVLGLGVRWAVDNQPKQVERAAWALYLNLPRGTEMPPETVIAALQEKLALASGEMWRAVGLLLLSVALAGVWLAGRLPRRAWVTGIGLVVAADLLTLMPLYTTPVALEEITTPQPAVQFLALRLGHGRYLNTTPLEAPLTNLPFGVADLNGQSSLNMERPWGFVAAALRSSNRLADLAGVEYLLVPNAIKEYRRWYNAVGFNQENPLALLTTDAPPTAGVFHVPPRPAEELRMALALGQAVDVPQGADVGEVVVRDEAGREQRFPIRAGIEVSEWAYNRPDVAAQVQHGRAEPAYTWRAPDDTGALYDRQIFYSRVPLVGVGDAPVKPTSVSFRATRPGVTLYVFGATLLEPATSAVVSLDRYMLDRYQLAYSLPYSDRSDAGFRLFENRTALPRAYMVGGALRYGQRWQALERLLLPSFDPTRWMTVEGDTPAEAAALVVPGPTAGAPLPTPPPSAAFAPVEWLEDGSTRVALRTASDAPGFLVLADTYYPGWTAAVDGVPTPVLLANYTFRGVYVPAGEHTVTFTYVPRGVTLGFALAGLTILLVAVAAGLLLVAARRRRQVGGGA
ncbi:MAG: YfhO family protein [Anaerolineae bacterium]